MRKGLLITAPYPEYIEERRADETVRHFGLLQDMIRGVRTLRSEFAVPPEKKVRVAVKVDSGFSASGFFKDHTALAKNLMNASELEIGENIDGADGAIQ